MSVPRTRSQSVIVSCGRKTKVQRSDQRAKLKLCEVAEDSFEVEDG